MSFLTLQIISAVIIWVITLSGGFSAIYLHKKNMHPHFTYFAEAFAGGIFLGAALFHMLPDAEAALRQVYPDQHYPFANLICAGGFCFLLLLEQITQYFGRRNKNLVPLLLTALISIHALSEGIALGVSKDFASIIIIFIAIAVHKSSEGFAVGIQLHKGSLSLKNIILLFILFSFMSPLGISLGALAYQGETLMGICNAFAAGTFLYIATLHKLHHHHEGSHLGELFFTLLGLSLMAIVAIWL